MKDLYKHLKGTKQKIDKKDFKESIIDLCEQFLKKAEVTGKERTVIYRIYSFCKITLKGF